MKTKNAAEVLPFLPAQVRNRLEELASSLKKTLGDDLTALLLHGSVVRGGYVAGQSDVDVLVIVKDDTPAKLESIGAALRLAQSAAKIECMILRSDEISRSADVFPLLYDDIRRCHALMHGTDPFADLVIHDEHKRLRIEQELRDARIRLRRLVATEALPGASLAEPVARKVKQLRSPLAALMRIHGALKDIPAHEDLDHTLHACAKHLKVDVGPLFHAARDPNKALAALRTLLDAAIADVDELVFPAGAPKESAA